ncbi:MAG: BON domain-containing protein, partial [Lysobacterales bacterium]
MTTGRTKLPTLRRRSTWRAAGTLLVCGWLFCGLLTGCTPAAERRSVGTMIDDQTAEIEALNEIYEQAGFDTYADHIKVEAHNGTLLLAGEVGSAEKKARAGKIAAQLKTVERVVNELEVMPGADTSGLLHNSYLTSKVNTRLMLSNPVPGFDPGRIKVLSAHGTVYLMGTVSRDQGDAVADVV